MSQAVEVAKPPAVAIGRPPTHFLAALALAAGFMAFVAWDQSHWWRVKEDYTFGWLVPVFVAYIVYDRWDLIRRRLVDASAAAPGPRWSRLTLNTAAVLGLVSGALFFLLGAFYRAGAGTSHPGTLALTLGMGAIVLPLIFFNVPVGEDAAAVPATRAPGWRALFADPRVRVAALFLFPALVWLVSAPIVSVVENQLSLFLRHKVAVAVMFTFDLLGHPLEQQGNVLVLPNGGTVGVEDACSGIRSLTACLFAGSFLGAAFFERLWQKVALVAAAMLFAFLTNIGRGLFLTAWAYRNGAESISGTVHDVAGYAVLGLTCLGLMLLIPLLNIRVERGGPAEAGAER
jgi:exosortase/archaeosortase family protein